MARQYVETRIGDATVLIEDISTKSTGRPMRDTAAGPVTIKPVDGVIDKMLPIIAELAKKGEETLSTLVARPDEVALTVGMGYDAQLDAWILKGDASLTFDVEITWKKDSKKDEDA